MKKLLLLALILLASTAMHAQVAKAKSMLILNFVRYVGWNESTREGNFVIGVVKDPDLADYLKQQTKGKKLGFQQIEIREFDNAEQVTNCHVLYVSSNFKYLSNYYKLMNKASKNTLIMTEEDGATRRGSMINLVFQGDELKFQLNKANAESAGIHLAAKLVDMSGSINRIWTKNAKGS